MEGVEGVALRVLLVDDDPLTLTVVGRVLAAAGHETLKLASGFGFAVALRRYRPDVVLLDIKMPGLGGAGALRVSRELESGVQPKIILHSGLSTAELEALAAELEVHAYLSKPASPQAILAAVEPAA